MDGSPCVANMESVPSVPALDLLKSQSCDKDKLSLYQLVVSLTQELNNEKNIDRIRHYMESFDTELGEWRRYRLFYCEKKYTRNLIATDHKTFALILLCLNPTKGSPIHSHSGSECVMRIVEGSLRESQYEWPEECLHQHHNEQHLHNQCQLARHDQMCHCDKSNAKQLQLKSAVDLHPPYCAHINDSIGLHKVENVSNIPAVSLHCYMPPYQTCLIFPEETSRASTCHATFYSEDGKIIQHCTF